MATITSELLTSKYNKWLKSDRSIPFGKMMNDRYGMRDDELSNEVDHNFALLIIMSKHVTEL